MADDNSPESLGTVTGGSAGEAAQEQKQVLLQSIYVKDGSFEAPNSPAVFAQKWEPKFNLNLQTNVNDFGDDVYELLLNVTVEAKLEDKTGFLVEVQQAGIFKFVGVGEEERKVLLSTYCPNVLFPYVREAVSSMVGRGGFPPFMLQPVNFAALYAQRQAELRASQAAGDAN